MVDGAEWLTTEDACELLAVSRRTLVRWTGEHPVERQTVFGERGKSYLYSRAALLHLVRQVRGEDAAGVTQRGAECPAVDEGPDAQLRHGEPRSLARPLDAHAEEFLDLLADLRDVLARASAGEGKAIEAVQEVGGVRAEVQQLRGAFEAVAEENRQLREVLSAVAARLPGPPAPPSPPPRLRWRVVAEVVLLGWVGLLAGVLGAVVLQRLADVGVVTLPAWWPIG